MGRPKIYLDTSVINFLFHDDAPEKKEVTIDFFENYVPLGIYETFISQFVIEEINQTPSETKKGNLLESIDKYRLELLANIGKERRVLALTYKMGYLHNLRIITPLELTGNEN